MAAAPKVDTYTVDQYLTMKRAALERHVSPGWGNLRHGRREPRPWYYFPQSCRVALRSGERHALPGATKDTKVRSGRTPMPGHSMSGMFSYPDIVVICGEDQYHDAFEDVVINPTAIIEVLSPATEAFDRGRKFTRYQKHNPTLREYVLVAQDEPKVEVFTREKDCIWQYCLHEGLEANVVLPSIQCTLKLADVYDRVQFPTGEDE